MAGMIRDGGMTWLETAANASSASTGIAVTSGGSAETYGSWAELIATTEAASDYALLQIFFPRNASNIRDFRVDLGVGGAGSETVIVSSLQMQLKEDMNNVLYYPLPLHIPAGSRVAVRTAANNTSVTLHVALSLFASGRFSIPGHSRVVTYGTGVNPAGVAIDPGGSTHTKGSWYEVISSVAYDIQAFFLNISSNNNTAHSDCTWLLDLAIGAAASEVAIVSNLFLSASQYEVQKGPIWLPIALPKGSRVAARAQCSITDATDRVITVSIAGCL